MEASPKKGTTTVGLVCKDGIVLAADKRATAGTRIANTKVDKVVQVADFMAMTTAGLVSDIQLFTKVIKGQLMLLKMRKGKEPSVKEAASLLGNLAYSNIRRPSMIPGIVGFLFGGYDTTKGYGLYEVAFDGTVLRVDSYASDGSGSSIALGVLETLYKPNMMATEGVQIAMRALQSAMNRDSATGNGLDVVIINEKGVQFVEHKVVKTTLK